MTDYDDYDLDDYDDERAEREPDCPPCMDSGRAQPTRWWRISPSYPRRRAGRARCRSCNPSPRQHRRNLHRERLRRQRWDRDVAAGRIPAWDDTPF